MKKEKQIFVINLRIKENNQEVKELSGKANLEITWQEKYKILVKINEIKKGWFKDKITELGGISPVPGSDFVIVENNKGRKEEGARRWNEEGPNQKIEPTKKRWGWLYIGGNFLFSFADNCCSLLLTK